MKILICYASREGQTRKICRFCADQLIKVGHSVEMLSAQDAEPLDLAGFDGAVLAGSVHMGAVQPELAVFARDYAGALNEMPSLFLLVSLAAAGGVQQELDELDQIASRFCRVAGWRPDAVHQIAGAFRFGEYDFFKTWAMRFIAARRGQDVDTSGDTEYTDWTALEALMTNWPPQSEE